MTTSFTIKNHGPSSILAEKFTTSYETKPDGLNDMAVAVRTVLEGDTIYPGQERTFTVWGDYDWRITEIE